jgi:hypothetical protein
LAWAWEKSLDLAPHLRRGVYAGVVVVIAFIGYTNVHAYFGPWAGSALFRWVYTQEISEASEYLEALPQRPYVYFFSARWRFDYETRQYLAPDLHGEDRSERFGRSQSLDIDRSRDSVFMLLNPYFDRLPEIERLYPGGTEYVGKEGNVTLFIAYFVPKQ